MHIVQVGNGLVPPVGYGGLERVVYWLIREFHKVCHRLTLITDTQGTAQAAFDDPGYIGIEAFRSNPKLLSGRWVEMVHFHNGYIDGLDENPACLVAGHGKRKKHKRVSK